MDADGSSRKASPTRGQDADVRVGWRMAGLAWRFTTEVIAGAVLGWLVGSWLGNTNMGALIGTGIGLAVAMYSLMRGALKLNASLDRLGGGRSSTKGIAQDSGGPADRGRNGDAA
ncbi:MAG: AtpZ/AtpI family protein [Planctomycetes bacterium]|nr:AtpZ/AtpI family protein [Planctomycetota bacterium]